jgi:hypothetical protein
LLYTALQEKTQSSPIGHIGKQEAEFFFAVMKQMDEFAATWT